MSELHVDESFWLDADQAKGDVDGLCTALHKRAQSGAPMRGFQLKRAQLAGIDLVNHNQRSGFDLRDSDLYRADLQKAHLFALDLRGSSLMKADLRGANLHCCDLRDCNLLGIQLDGARLDNVIWDRRLRQIASESLYALEDEEDEDEARSCGLGQGARLVERSG